MHERNSNCIEYHNLQLMLDKTIATKQKPTTDTKDVGLMNEALHLVDGKNSDYETLKPYLDKVEQLFNLGLLIDFNVVGPTKKKAAADANLEESKDEAYEDRESSDVEPSGEAEQVNINDNKEIHLQQKSEKQFIC